MLGKQTARNTTGHKVELVIGEELRSEKPVLESQLDILSHGSFSDVTFVVGERKERIPCHQLFLKIRSPVFEVMFSERWNKDTAKEVPLEDVNPETFKKFLEFIYADTFDADVSEALELLQVADKYDVQRLVHKCVKLLENQVTLDYAIGVFQAARKYGKIQLMDKAGDLLANSLSEMQSLPSFTQLDKETLMYILKRDDFEMNEIDLFNVALKWAGNQTDATVEESLQDIIPLIRFPTMTLNEFATTVVPTRLLSPSAVVELVTYFGTDDRAKRWFMAGTLGFSAQQRQPKDRSDFTKIYPIENYDGTKIHQRLESLRECLQFRERQEICPCTQGILLDQILGIGISGFTFHCPVALNKPSVAFRTFEISLKSKVWLDHYDDYYNQYDTELVNMSAVKVQEGRATDVRFHAVIPLKQRTMYCITVEEIQPGVGGQCYDAVDFGARPKEHVLVTVKNRDRTLLNVERNKLAGCIEKAGTQYACPHLISRLGFQEL